MKSQRRSALLFLMLALLALALTGCNRGPSGLAPYTIEHAQQLEAEHPAEAVGTYQQVSSQSGSNPELAAQAQFDLAEFAGDPARYGTAAHAKVLDPNTPAAKQAMADKQVEGDQYAVAALLNIQQHYGETAIAHNPATEQLLLKTEHSIDVYNSHNLNYKIINFLVTMTGSKPAFSYWFALVLIAVFIKAITAPLMIKSYKSTREMQKIQPILKQIQAKYKDDPQEAMRKTQEAYKEHGVNPFASCVPALVQMPVFFWMIYLIRLYQYHFVYGKFLWIGSALSYHYPNILGRNLGELDWPLLLLYAGTMFISTRMTPAPDPQMAEQQKMTSVIMTGFMIYWFWQSRWGGAFLLYYLVQNLLTIVQQYYFVYVPNKEKMASEAAGGGSITIPTVSRPAPSAATTALPSAPRARPRRKKR